MTGTGFGALPVLVCALELLAYGIYARSVLRGEIVPSRATWLIWAPLVWLTAGSAIDAGAGVVAVKAVASAIGCTAIAILSIRHGTGGWSRSDQICLALATIGISGWIGFEEPAFALAWFILADAVGAVPTIRDVARDPSRERPAYWLLCSTTSLLALLLVAPESWQLTTVGFSEWGYPIYLIVINSLILTVMFRGRIRGSASVPQRTLG